MLKKIKILLFITITALVLPGMVHADMSAYNNVCISPGSPCAGRIADLENQYGKHMARIADLENQYGKHMARIADLEAQLAAPAGPSPELLAAQARIADLEAQLAAPTAAPTACAATPARVADLENQYVKHQRLIADICRFSTSNDVNIIRNNANAFGVSLPPSCTIPR